MSNNVNVIEEIGQRKPEHPREQDRRYKNSNNRKTESGANVIPRSDLYDKYPLTKINSNRRNGGRKYKMKKSMRIKSYKKNNKTRRRRSKRI
jgi:hypothetical protein